MAVKRAVPIPPKPQARKKPTRPPDEYDPPWKEIIGLYFADFLLFFFPEAHADIDWQRSYESLDTELNKITRDAALGKRIADKLIKVWLKNGEKQYILIHVEVQGKKEEDFEERMFVYNYRVFDFHRRIDGVAPEVISFAILTDASEEWSPSEYSYGRWKSRMGLEFDAVKLRGYNNRWAELEANSSPFAVAVMAYLKARETRKDSSARLRWKGRLVRQLYERGFERKKILALFRFIDWVMKLPEDLAKQFRDEHKHYESEHGMRYVTSIERMGIKQGMEQGIQKGKTALLKNQLVHRFTELPAWVEKLLAEARQEDLEKWSLKLLDARSLEDVFATA